MDQLKQVEGHAGLFHDEAGKTLADYLRLVVPPGARASWIGAQ